MPLGFLTKSLLLPLLIVMVWVMPSFAQNPKAASHFRFQSPADQTAPGYGSILVETSLHETKVIEQVIAYGENVKSVNITINGVYSYKLAPASGGQNLNYVGSGLSIVLKDGDKAIIDFTPASKVAAARQLYLSGYVIE